MSVYIYLKNLIQTSDEQGASLVEYALLVALIALVAVVAITTFGSKLSTSYSDIAQTMP